MTTWPWRAGWYAALIQLRLTLVTPVALAVAVLQPVVFLCISLIGRSDASSGQPDRIVVGAALLSLWSNTLWAGGSVLRREARGGTLAGIVAAPPPLMFVLLAKTLGATVAAAALAAVSTAGSCLLLGVTPAFNDIRYAAPAVLLCLVSSVLLGITVSGVTLLTRAAQRVIEALMYPVFILSGLLIPLTELPAPLRYPSALMTFRWGSDLITGSPQHPVRLLLLMAVLTAGYAVAAVASTNFVERRTRRDATLDLV